LVVQVVGLTDRIEESIRLVRVEPRHKFQLDLIQIIARLHWDA